MTIWLIGGTSDSANIARIIFPLSLPCLITVTTESALSLYADFPSLSRQVRQLNEHTIKAFCQENNIKLIIDASHPYAQIISQLAINYANLANIPYLRYERALITQKTGVELDSLETLLQGDYLLGQRVLLTLGYKALPQFRPWHDRAILFTRLLPVVNSLETALKAGFTSDRIIALRPPISADLERALWRNWHISLIVTKASGKEGGEAIKKSVATELGINLITIARPSLNYPRQTSNFPDIIAFCQQYYV
jgi:precorrin-6A/cobalt-precorrin-6A reductase